MIPEAPAFVAAWIFFAGEHCPISVKAIFPFISSGLSMVHPKKIGWHNNLARQIVGVR